MSTIGGPGGIGGPKGPSGPSGPSGPGATDEAGEVAEQAAVDGAERAGLPADVDALAAEVAAGRLTPREAIDRLVEAMAGPELGPTERAELRELLGELVANDPHLAALAGRV